jgi:uncharacterized membrane protein
MNTHAAAGKRWTEEQLAGLVVEKDVRLRGLEVTRLDTFVDAAFAFVLTLLVISFDDLPSDYAEMLTAVKRIPGFAASFAILMMFWLQHRMWSRRYGLENQATLLYSLLLIFVMLVYVYPLRMIFEGMFSNLTGGYLSTSYQIETYGELRMIFVFYSVGFFAMSLIVSQLYRIARRNSEALALNSVELRKTRIEIEVWALAAGYAVLSVLLALTLPDAWVVTAGYMYFVLIPAMRIPALLDRRRHAVPVTRDS